jgi:TolA-binding protein
LATVKGSEKLVDDSRKRLIEMEDLAQQHLNAANDADLARDYVKEVEELGIVLREFAFTKAVEQATTRLAALKPRKEVAGLIELAQAGAAESAGNLAQAYKLYKAIAENPRYENTLAALKGKKAAEKLQNDEATRENLKTQLKAEADKEAPPLLNSGHNFLLNHQEAQAKEKFQQVVEKYPGTDYAEEAKKELAKLR